MTLGMLRKCFSLQPQIRLVLYEGLMNLMDFRHDLNRTIFETIYPHVSMRVILRAPSNYLIINHTFFSGSL